MPYLVEMVRGVKELGLETCMTLGMLKPEQAEELAGAGLDCRIDAIPTSGYPTPAQRPGNSRLDCSDLTHDFGIAQPDWRAFLPQMITELQS